MSTSAATPSRSFGKGNPKSIQNQLCLSPVVKAMTQLRVERQRKARRETENMCVCTRSHNHILACLVSLFREAGFQACTLLSPGFSTLRISIQSMIMWRTCIPSTCALDLHGSADNPSLNGTLRRQDLDLALSQRAQAKVDKYRQGYAAPGLRHAFLPAIVSTSGRIHGELLRLLFNLADKKTSNSLAALGEAIDVESEVYCRRRSGNFWRMRASLGLACAQAATLGTQVVGRPRSRPRAAARPRT